MTPGRSFQLVLDGTPDPHPDRWRLDQLLPWDEKRMALAAAALEALVAPDRELTTVTDLLPQPKRRRGA